MHHASNDETLKAPDYFPSLWGHRPPEIECSLQALKVIQAVPYTLSIYVYTYIYIYAHEKTLLLFSKPIYSVFGLGCLALQQLSHVPGP